ncbi:MAG TPA: hypothetical protein V6C52_02260 [Coleofasciculaceae cyanobacterium]|jgi:hypothetical protein
MFHTIGIPCKFQSPKTGNVKKNLFFGSRTSNHPVGDTVRFGNNKEAAMKEAQAQGCYDPPRTVEAMLTMGTNRPQTDSDIPTSEVIKAMEKWNIKNNYQTTLEEILDGTSRWDTGYTKSADRILEEVERAIHRSGNQTSIVAMNEEIQNNIKPYLLKGHFRAFGGALYNTKSLYPDWQKSVALAHMIGESASAKENPDPWVVILDHMMNDPNVYRTENAIRYEAAEALNAIGNSPEHLEVLARCKASEGNCSDAHLNGKCSAGENMIAARIAAKKANT